MELITIPKTVSYKRLLQEMSISPSDYQDFVISNPSITTIQQLLQNNKPKNGKEVGSISYVKQSIHKFIRTKALQNNYILLDFNSESIISIKPVSFKKMNLKEGEILITKDSNVGEVVYLEKDYNNFMLSAGIKSLNFPKDKYYILAFLKSDFIKKQIELMISRGAIIKHAKDTFLDCKIPFPSKDKENTVKYISLLVKSWIRKEIELKKKFKKIDHTIKKEIENNQKEKTFSFDLPKFSEIGEKLRFDVGVYNEDYKKIIHLIENYSSGYFTISEDKFKSGSTPKNRILGIGNKKWVTPTSISHYGHILTEETIFCEEQNIKKDCVLIINRTSKGGLGEYVGISLFYDYKIFGDSHHNQGFYKIEDYETDDLKLIALLLNSEYYRVLCGAISLGSKMKEIKINNLTKIPFPNLKKDTKNELIKLYSNPTTYSEILLNNFEEKDSIITKNSGILELSYQIKKIRDKINESIMKIAKNQDIQIDFEFLF